MLLSELIWVLQSEPSWVLLLFCGDGVVGAGVRDACGGDVGNGDRRCWRRRSCRQVSASDSAMVVPSSKEPFHRMTGSLQNLLGYGHPPESGRSLHLPSVSQSDADPFHGMIDFARSVRRGCCTVGCLVVVGVMPGGRWLVVWCKLASSPGVVEYESYGKV